MPTISVATLMALPQWSRSVRVVYQSTKNNNIASFHLTASSDRPSSFGTLECLTNSDLPAWKISTMIRRCVDDNAVGLVVPELDMLDEPARQLARRFNLTLLAVVNGGSIVDLVVDGRVHLAAHELTAARTVLQIPAILDRSLTPESAFPAIARLLSVTIALTRQSGAVVAGAGPDLSRFIAPPSEGRSIDPDTALEILGKTITRSDRTDSGISLFIAAPVAVGLSSVAYSAFSLLTNWVGSQLEHQDLARERDRLRQEGIASGIPVEDFDKTDCDKWYVGLHFSPAESHPVDHAALRHAFAQESLEPILVVQRNSNWTGWLTLARAPTDSSNEHLQLRIGAVVTALELRAGIGSSLQGVEGLRRSINEAVRAGVVATRRRSEAGTLLTIDELSDTETLLLGTQTAENVSTARGLLGDVAESPELLLTLRVYLDEQSVVTTASTLGVHRNTVSGRIARIRKMVRADLDSPDGRLAALLASRLIESGHN